MKKKQQKKRVKKYKGKYVTANRVDMSKGGRVKAQVGGMQKAPGEKEDRPMSIEIKTPVKKKPQPTVTPKKAEVVTEPKPAQPQAQQQGFAQAPTTTQQPPMSVGGVGGSGNVDLDEQFGAVGGETEQEPVTPTPVTQPASPEIMRKTTPPDTTFTTINEQGEQVTLPNMSDWEKQWLKDNPKPTKGGGLGKLVRIQNWEKQFNIAKEKHQADLDNATVTFPTTTTAQQQAAFEDARRERIRETGLQIEAASTGQVPEGAIIPEAEKVGGIDPKTGLPIGRQRTTTMADTTKVGYQRDAEGNLILDEQGDPIQIQAGQVAPEAVTTGQVTTAQTPEQIQAAQMEAAMITPDAQVEAAAGEVSDQAIARAAGVERVAPIEGAEVEIPAGALAERVVGTISEGAKATAAMNAGTSLSRITRAKKQLSRAGLSDADIQEIGNDPEALEDRLADFSEEQRGIIEGLPEEALVSTQINGLLEGMENGEIPVWARPAVAQVEQMLAQRGMSASTVGRDSLFNAIIQSAMPIAQSNAQAIQSSVAQQRDIEARESEANAQRMQQTALTNAQNVFQMDMAQFSADQQTALSNSKFLQTVGLTEASNEQQAVIQDALLMSQANLAEADFYQKAQIQNAQAFLSMDMANLNNQQQANVLKAQQNQQRLLSNQSAQNAAAQFNAASENQTNQFMANLNAQMNQYNASQMNAMEQFNATQANAAEARRANREADIEKFNAQLIAQVDQFNSQQDFARNQWNAANAATVEASNVQWRRQANTINTAAQNQINMQNAQNAFGLSSQAMSFLWQELRDQADFDFRSFENEENRKAQIIATAMANEGEAGEKYDDYLTALLSSVSSSFKSGLGTYTTTSYGGGVKQF